MYTLDDIKKEDPEIASAITDEFERQNRDVYKRQGKCIGICSCYV